MITRDVGRRKMMEVERKLAEAAMHRMAQTYDAFMRDGGVPWPKIIVGSPPQNEVQ